MGQLTTKKLTIINILAIVLRSDPDDDQERAMPTMATSEIRKPARDTDLLGHCQVEPQTSHPRFGARTLAGLVKTAGRFDRSPMFRRYGPAVFSFAGVKTQSHFQAAEEFRR